VNAYNLSMRVILGIIIAVGLSMGMYSVYLKSFSGGKAGASPMSVVSTTTVKMQLLNIASAEKTYYSQNNEYATMEELTTSGWFTPKDPDPTGYSYDIAVAKDPAGFVVTASHLPGTNGNATDYPTLSIDQSMKVSGGD